MTSHRRVLVTGANGFIGKNLVPYLQKRGLEVDTFVGDVVELNAYAKPADVVVHLASRVYSSLEKSSQDNYEPYRTNVLGMVSACEYAVTHGASIIFSSSSAVYDEPQGLGLVSENHPTHAKSLNAITKRLAEDILKSFALNHRISVDILRLFNVYGPHQQEPYLIPYLLRCIREDASLEIRNPHGIRDYVYVDDVCEAIYLAVTKTRASSEIGTYNIGSGTRTSVMQLISELAEITKRSPKIVSPATISDEVSAMVADSSLAAAVFGWKSKTTLVEGLKKTVAAAQR